MSGRPSSSWVWKDNGGFFEKKHGKAVCAYPVEQDDGSHTDCGLTLVINTGNMAKHLTSEHMFSQSEWADERAKGLKGGMSRWLASGSIVLTPEELKAQQTALSVALANSLLPVSVFAAKPPLLLHTSDVAGHSGAIEAERFTLGSWLQQLVPQFKTGMYKTLQSRLSEEVEQHLDVDVRFLVEEMIGVGFTTDAFESQSGLYFHSVSAHGVVFFDRRPLYLSFLLANESFPSGTAADEAAFLRGVLEQWNISEERRLGATVDGAERAALRAAGIPYLWCPAHVINLAIHDVTQRPLRSGVPILDEHLPEFPLFKWEVADLLGKVKRTVSFFSSRVVWADLERAHVNLGTKEPLKHMKADVATRWNSELIAVQSVLDSWDSQNEYFRMKRGAGRILSKSDHKALSELVYLLSAPAAVATAAQGWAYPTGVSVFPDLFKCLLFWLECCTSEKIQTALMKETRDCLVSALVGRLARIAAESENLVLALCAFSPWFWRTRGERYEIEHLWDAHSEIRNVFPALDTGAKFVGKMFGNLKGCVSAIAPAQLKDCCKGLYCLGSPIQEVRRSAEQVGVEPLHKQARVDVHTFFNDAVQQAPKEYGQELHDEAKLFVTLLGPLAGKPLLAAYHQLILRQQCPRFVHVALAYLGITGSNAPSESVFSDTGLVTSGRRAATGADWAEVQVKTHRNHDTVRKLRDLCGTKHGEALREAWGRFHARSEMDPK